MNATQALVADFMTIDPIVVAEDAPLEEAARLLRANAVSGLPVVDLNGSLVGVISQTDFVAVLESPIGRLIRTEASGLRTGELMSSPAITIPMASPMIEAARLMRDRHVHRLVALDDAGRAVGVVAAWDFVTLYADA
jgi:CBS domain-containing protein